MTHVPVGLSEIIFTICRQWQMSLVLSRIHFREIFQQRTFLKLLLEFLRTILCFFPEFFPESLFSSSPQLFHIKSSPAECSRHSFCYELLSKDCSRFFVVVDFLNFSICIQFISRSFPDMVLPRVPSLIRSIPRDSRDSRESFQNYFLEFIL